MDRIKYICKEDPDFLLNSNAALMIGLVIDNLIEGHAQAVIGGGGEAIVGIAMSESSDDRVSLEIMELSERNEFLSHCYGFHSSYLTRYLVENQLDGRIAISDTQPAKAIIALDRARIEADRNGIRVEPKAG